MKHSDRLQWARRPGADNFGSANQISIPSRVQLRNNFSEMPRNPRPQIKRQIFGHLTRYRDQHEDTNSQVAFVFEERKRSAQRT